MLIATSLKFRFFVRVSVRNCLYGISVLPMTDEGRKDIPTEHEILDDLHNEWESSTVEVQKNALKFNEEYVIYSFPRYLADILDKSLNGQTGGIVGYMHDNKFVLSDTSYAEDVPQEYELGEPVSITRQTFLAEIKTVTDDDNGDEKIKSFGILGNIQKRIHVKTDPEDELYLGFKESTYAAKKPRIIQEDTKKAYEPIVVKRPTLPKVENRRKWSERRERGEEEDVKEMLLECFAEQRYYTLNELVDLTDQPHQFLKSVLSDLCIYHTGEVNRNKYELKPEYSQHVKK
ncbi:hypothetical protein ACOME3_003570 [Neoechinorhynchus agilis]